MKCKMKSEERAKKYNHLTTLNVIEKKGNAQVGQNYLVLRINYFLVKKTTTGIAQTHVD